MLLPSKIRGKISKILSMEFTLLILKRGTHTENFKTQVEIESSNLNYAAPIFPPAPEHCA